jgi:hypothetical protein
MPSSLPQPFGSHSLYAGQNAMVVEVSLVWFPFALFVVVVKYVSNLPLSAMSVVYELAP